MRPTSLALGACALALAAVAQAQEPLAVKKGPLSRPASRPDKAGLQALCKALDEALAKGDLDAAAQWVDFPILMATDGADGEFSYTTMDRETWRRAMTERREAQPAGAKLSVTHAARQLSDTLAEIDEEHALRAGKVRTAWRSSALAVKRQGRWKLKMLTEAGWGDALKAGEASTSPAH